MYHQKKSHKVLIIKEDVVNLYNLYKIFIYNEKTDDCSSYLERKKGLVNFNSRLTKNSENYNNTTNNFKINSRNNSNNEITYDGTTLDLSDITLNVNTINAAQLDFTNLSTNIPTESGRLYKDSNNFLKIS